jgi:hypothetical protein
MTTSIHRQPVESSCLASVGYAPELRTLEVEFCNGLVYRYYDVGPLTYDNLVRSESKGRYLNQAIKGHHRYARC